MILLIDLHVCLLYQTSKLMDMVMLITDGFWPQLITMCVFGNPADKAELAEQGEVPSTPAAPKEERTFQQNAKLLSFCFVGLQVRLVRYKSVKFKNSLDNFE